MLKHSGGKRQVPVIVEGLRYEAVVTWIIGVEYTVKDEDSLLGLILVFVPSPRVISVTTCISCGASGPAGKSRQ
jgi:hypothetical protein